MKHVVPVAYRPPFQTLGYIDERPHGQTILEIVRSVPNLPPIFMQRGVVLINGEVVPNELWAHVRPKPTSNQLPVAVTMHLPLAGGGGKGGAKSIIGLVAALALVVVTAGIASFGVPFLGIAAGSFAATATAGAVGLAGALAISALTKPPTSGGDPAATSDTNTDQKEPASASGNVIEQGGPIPRVLGTRRIYPPLIGEPIVELVGTDEFVEAAFVMNGSHFIDDLRIDGVPIDSTDDVEFETRGGFDTDTPLTLTTRQGRTITPQLTLSEHILDKNGTNGKELLHPGSPTDDLPIWHGFVSRKSPDEIWIHLQLPAGISVDADKNIFRAFPIRMRMRLRGSVTWINVPEFHLADSTVNPQRKAIIIKWANFPGLVTPPANSGFVEAHFSPPVQASGGGTASPNSVVTWVANSWFDDGAGNEYLYSANTATKITNMNLFENRVEIFLEEAVPGLAKGIWEIQLMRGTQYQRNGGAWVVSTYKVAGVVYDFFYYNTSQIGVPAVPATMRNTTGAVIVSRFISIWNQYPIPVEPGDFALIAIKARNRSIQRLSCEASGIVSDWDGTGWNNETITSNPAPHYVDVLSGALNKAPLPGYLRDDAALVAWRTLCANHDWTCDAIISDMRTQDVLSLLASCGYARPYQSEVYGVVVDTNRDTDSPIQVFSPMNATNVRWEKAFAQVPAGFIVSFRDDENDDDRSQTIVSQRDPTVATNDSYESISFDGIIDETKVIDRAQFDLDQANERSTFYYLDTDIESLVCRKGDLVALQHDIISHWAGTARVKTKNYTGSPATVASVILNSELPLGEDDALPGIMIRNNDGTLSTHTISAMSGNQVTFSPPIANTFDAFDETDGKSGALVVSGTVNSEYKRMLVAAINTSNDLKASLVLVDEAPNLIRHNAPIFHAGFEAGNESELGGSANGTLLFIDSTEIEGSKFGLFPAQGSDPYRESTTGHNKTDVVLSCYIWMDAYSDGFNLAGFCNSSDDRIAWIQVRGDGRIGFNAYFDDEDYGTFVFPLETWQRVEMRLIIAGGGNGALAIVVEGNLAYFIDGIDTNGIGNIDRSFVGSDFAIDLALDAWTMTVPF